MADFTPFSLANVFQNVEAVKGMRNDNLMAGLQQKFMGQQMDRAGAQERRAAAQESRAQAQFDQEGQVFNTKLLNMAAAEVAQNPNAARRWDSVLKAAIPNWEPVHGDPAQIQAAAKQLYESTSAALSAYQGNNGGSAQPAELATFNAMSQGMSPEDVARARRIQLGLDSRAGQSRVTSVAGVPTLVGVGDDGKPFQIPLSSLTAEADAAGAKAGAEAAARAGAESDAARNQKLPALASMDYVIEQYTPMLTQTPTGGPMGAMGVVGGVFDYQDAARFDNLREQLSTELRTVFRIPGEGTLSDREQAQYGLQLPDRKYSPPVNEAILRDVRNRASIRITGDRAPQGSAAPNVGTVEDGYRFKGGDPADPNNWVKVQ